jgi:hypothetical protein
VGFVTRADDTRERTSRRRQSPELKAAVAEIRKALVERNKLARTQLLKLLDIQATLLQREITTSDILRYRLLDLGVPVEDLDRPPYMVHPVTGRPPPKKPLRIGIGFSDSTPPELPIVVPVEEMSPENFRKHIRYRHGDKQDATIGTHEWLHAKAGKETHEHAKR